MKQIGLTAALVLAAGCAAAQQPAPAAPSQPAPCSSEAYRQFDFWLGTWDVAAPDGTLAGRNQITAEEGGCLILERWTSASGGTGQSYNFYDPGTRMWRQVWVSAGAVIDYSGGLTRTGTMKLEGEIRYHTGTAFPFTGEWTLQADGTVRQHFEQFDPETDTWNPWFTGIYTKVDGAASD